MDLQSFYKSVLGDVSYEEWLEAKVEGLEKSKEQLLNETTDCFIKLDILNNEYNMLINKNGDLFKELEKADEDNNELFESNEKLCCELNNVKNELSNEKEGFVSSLIMANKKAANQRQAIKMLVNEKNELEEHVAYEKREKEMNRGLLTSALKRIDVLEKMLNEITNKKKTKTGNGIWITTKTD